MSNHILTETGIFIPEPSKEERELIYTPPEKWAESAAHKVSLIAARAYHYANEASALLFSGHPWEIERAQLVEDGWEQWLLWMEHDPC